MPELQDQLIEETRSESEDIKVIAKSVMTIEEKVAGFRSQAENEEARNKIIPGAVSGLSSYEIASRVLNEEFTPEVIESARKIDLFTESIDVFLQSIGARATIGGVKAADAVINSESPQQARGVVEEEFKKLFGDSDLANTVSSFVGSISKWANEFVSKVNGYTTDRAGISLTPAKNDNTHTGQDGRETPLAARSTAESDLRAQASYSVSNGSNPTLSPGAQSEVALARAFFREAEIYILDEPSAALDAESEDQLISKFEELYKDKGAILVSHRLSNVKNCDYYSTVCEICQYFSAETVYFSYNDC